MFRAILVHHQGVNVNVRMWKSRTHISAGTRHSRIQLKVAEIHKEDISNKWLLYLVELGQYIRVDFKQRYNLFPNPITERAV